MTGSSSVVHLTFHKCGSQWVRDVLTAPEIVAHSGVPLFQSGHNLSKSWPPQPAATFMGPLYNKSREEWKRRQDAPAKAVVVLRDPRDRLVSWLFHRALPKDANPAKQALAGVLLRLPMRQRIALGMILNRADHETMRTWSGPVSDVRTFLTSYEALVADSPGEYRRIVDFLGWNVPDLALAAVVARLSFQTRSGRPPGEVDVFSHYRKGVAGDWRNYFDAELGALWEDFFPGLLTGLGYESREDWHHDLPPRPELDEGAGDMVSPDLTALAVQTQLVKLQEENAELRRNLSRSQGKHES